MPLEKILSPNFSVSVDVTYLAKESKPEEACYFFGYKVKIANNGTAPAQLISRHWIISDSFNHTEEVRGAGVVGLQPKINPNQTFEYESFCPLPTTSGAMKGSFQMVDDKGNNFEIEIPEFYLIAPAALH